MMPQFARAATYRPQVDNFARRPGVLRDRPGQEDPARRQHGAAYADAVFDGARAARHRRCSHAWFGALAYTLQLYFDFSGYSDMAIGLSLLFGVRLPLQFRLALQGAQHHRILAPLAHDAVAIPARLPVFPARRQPARPIRRYVNLLVTMLLGGLWHGAAWTFVVWGGLHGIYLIINHAWQWLWGRVSPDKALARSALVRGCKISQCRADPVVRDSGVDVLPCTDVRCRGQDGMQHVRHRYTQWRRNRGSGRVFVDCGIRSDRRAG